MGNNGSSDSIDNSSIDNSSNDNSIDNSSSDNSIDYSGNTSGDNSGSINISFGRSVQSSVPSSVQRSVQSSVQRSVQSSVPSSVQRSVQRSKQSSIQSSINISGSVQLYRTLSHANPSGNMFFSPLSISSALAMVYLGARGDTAAQMEKALIFSSGEEFHAEFKKLIADINSPSASYILKTANRLYGEKTAKFLPQFLEATCKYYQSGLKTVDFIRAAEASRVEINTWVEQQTENKIKDLLKPRTVSAVTKLVLVNAIYFKGNWMNRFDKAQTKEMPFKVSQNESKPVQMMYQKMNLHCNYDPDHALQILELPYEKDELSMLILLPKRSTDGSDPLLKLEKEVTLERLKEWTNKKNNDDKSYVHVHLPKFKLEEDYELNEPLSKLGMTDAFCASKADLSGMNGKRDLFLSKVVHKAVVEVNEEGTEAAADAATGAVVTNTCCGLKEEHFTADHPFLFYITHNKTQTILFLGRFSSPQ
ncbi:leukocyte elastase inhibitor-like isoform X2 [Hippoglossus stenolepis]|uniref:leukocyte elastase inhibitor-like isoform X2 n=1 Tax=Hippoglossus stenolepis TaxID=195615 RepID=UPI001FAF903F|nr:leukocyte elastase inhibitor-like isoform X2 [Hippoglossus stenolepis]